MSQHDDAIEVGKHLQGRSSNVRDGFLGDKMVSKVGGDAFVGSDRISVVGDMVYKNGTYVGSVPPR